MHQDAVKVPIGDWAEKRFRSMSKNDFIRHLSKNNKHLGRNVSNWLNRKKVYPHNVIVFEEEHLVNPSNVIEFATECKNVNHSAAFPLELPTWFIKLFTKENGIVLDPFMGSGTTAVASILLNREFVGIELQKDFINEIRRNIKNARTLKKAKEPQKAAS